ncbi:thioesterase family protein [Antrihabitans cavernicola]|uniref:Thioesterase family protein n=1 Tax=Antrihabitans cavernicola TaxID=2495913 RepID=A0A5A7SIW2_9NOCA|nr:thioesterase family protein [Spelaeibacter cavernicola]KAA0024533.1 thioesterase family protein [Spelaeibacter cavernicola]
MDAFYLPDPSNPNRFESTELTRGPWSPDAQHGGPPAGLLAHAIERCEPRDGFQVGRVSVEILGPVPLAPLTVEAKVARPGRNVEMIEAQLSSDRGPVMKATAWRIHLADPPLELPDSILPTGTRPGPELASADVNFPTTQKVGFHTAIEYRFVEGSFTEPGPAVCWIRLKHPIVAGTDPSPLERTMAAADSSSGVSATLDWNEYIFINTDLTVTLHRHPVGEWVCLDAVTYPQPHGIGMTEAAVFDQQGPVGRSTQTLLINRRT